VVGRRFLPHILPTLCPQPHHSLNNSYDPHTPPTAPLHLSRWFGSSRTPWPRGRRLPCTWGRNDPDCAGERGGCVGVGGWGDVVRGMREATYQAASPMWISGAGLFASKHFVQQVVKTLKIQRRGVGAQVHWKHSVALSHPPRTTHPLSRTQHPSLHPLSPATPNKTTPTSLPAEGTQFPSHTSAAGR
jgi:hypothetical protein